MSHFLMAFEEIDQDNNGEITIPELKRYMSEQNYEDKFVDKFMKLFDMDGDGSITTEEYCQTLGIINNDKSPKKHRQGQMYLASEGRLPARHVTVLSSDMPSSMQNITLLVTREGMEDKLEDQDIAERLKQTLDRQFDRAWHVIVGPGPFGSFISNERERLFHFCMNGLAVLIWKTPDY